MHTKKRTSPGDSSPLGATIISNGVNFALYSKHAHQVFLVLFDYTGSSSKGTIRGRDLARHAVQTDAIDMHKTGDIWHVYVQDIGAGQLYGFRVKGEYNPKKGLRFNDHKVLIDPYAKAITGSDGRSEDLLLGFKQTSSKKDLHMDSRDSASAVPKSIVIDDTFDWQGVTAPGIPMEQLVIYEVHVKGFTAHSSSGVKYPGTYVGFIEKIPYLRQLGVNAVEFLPIQEAYTRHSLQKRQLQDYWGYNTIGFFAPESAFAFDKMPGSQVTEFKTMVRELHKAGIEVILDVVYNHTGEGGHLGPTLCFRGIDNLAYYLLEGPKDEPHRFYVNDTGTGNTLNIEHPQTLQLVLDSMRYWVEVMHVDGFRFDLATILARKNGRFDPTCDFFKTIEKDPVLSNIKLIAEPWDLSTYQVGNFPPPWGEWNGKYRDTARRYLRGDEGQISDLAYRLTGSEDLFGNDGRSTHHSVNFLTCHDGFTLNDLFSYNRKHNEANGEDNRDGADENFSCNCGVEGPTHDLSVLTLRRKLMKNAICLLFLSLGTPMVLSGDECRRSQGGNNNAYCQDNEISWFNWSDVKQNRDMFEFCKNIIDFRNRHTVLQRKSFLLGEDVDGDTVPDIQWFGADVSPPVWEDHSAKLLCFQLDGSEVPSPLGEYHLFVVFNAYEVEQKISVPQYSDMVWFRVIDTSREPGEDFLGPEKEEKLHPQEHFRASPRSVSVLLAR